MKKTFAVERITNKIVKGAVLEYKTEKEGKYRYLYCGKLKKDGKTKYLLYRYNVYDKTAGYELQNKNWPIGKELYMIEYFPYSAQRNLETFKREYLGTGDAGN